MTFRFEEKDTGKTGEGDRDREGETKPERQSI